MTRSLWVTFGVVTILASGQAIAAGTEVTSPCGDAKKVLEGLHQRYSEKPAFSGVLQSGDPFTLTVGPSGGWTFLVARREGQMCVVAAGNQWQVVPSQTPSASLGSLPDAPALLPHGLLLIGADE
jgi:hypothetical protein